MQEQIRYWVWLSAIPGVGSRKAAQLLEVFKNPENVWNASPVELSKLTFLAKSDLYHLSSVKLKNDVQKHLEKIYKNSIQVITIQDELYPDYLKNIYDPPFVLYTIGKLLKDERAIAVVGSRKATAYGLKMAETIAYELSKCGITVISGMARGVDSYAHKGSLRADGRTIAVLGCGPDIVYPAENRNLRDMIIKSGAVVSEYIPEVAPVPQNFPARNRIISGMSLGVVVIEASDKSGSLITANFALEQGREVFAVPGNVNNLNSKGTNNLIKDGAKMVTDIDDILEELKVFSSANNNENRLAENKKAHHNLNHDERSVADCLEMEAMHIDIIAAKTGMSVSVLNSILIMMELRGIIEQLPGKIFKLKE